MDPIGKHLQECVRKLLATRPDLDRQTFGRLIDRETPSWLSEFFSGKRTTNDLRLVARMAEIFGVSVSYLIAPSDEAPDPGAATLLATWKDITDANDRAMLLQIASSFRRRGGPPSDERGGAPNHGTRGEGPNNRGGGLKPRAGKRR